MSHYQKAYFLLSAADVKQLPQDEGIEVAIVGRSNAGKSSVLNKLTHQKNLARVSKTPGRTQLINVFVLDDKRRIMDLPGYGYAKVPPSVKQKWEKTIDAYINHRLCLRALLLIMDIRHPLRELDDVLLHFCQQKGIAVHILLNKSDKLSKQQTILSLKKVITTLKDYPNLSVQTFSAETGQGLKELKAVLDEWYAF